ncbi:MerR family transcriptional regulator [Spongisporangium articulatum]|uniref:MerR family transcriptional regulator n=1 Tax=Spongisporangium articulatum TaxID=3362603 RepID=A0ABW8AM97_9ACTN
MITISQLAAFAGVTVRAVRHYHARGLLPEPERDPSGYRRYDAQAVVDLIRIRTLAEAGVPLARVKDLLAADDAHFTAALAEIDGDLRQRIRQLQKHRRSVALLASGETLGLPEAVVGYLELLRGIGVSERTVEMERQGWILIAARTPEVIEGWIAEKRAGLEDERFRSLYLGFDQLFDADVDDPRIERIADELAAFVRDSPAPTAEAATPDDVMVGLIDSYVLSSSPAWRRVAERAQERGLTGWSDLRDLTE